MPTDAQRTAMLAAMGIATYRLRGAAPAALPLRVALDAQSRICIDGGDAAGAERLLALLPDALGVAREAVMCIAIADHGNAIDVAPDALRHDAASRRALWQALKPLLRRLRRAE